MSNKKITDLPAAGALDGTEPVELVQSAASVQSTASDVAKTLQLEDTLSFDVTGSGTGFDVIADGGAEFTLYDNGVYITCGGGNDCVTDVNGYLLDVDTTLVNIAALQTIIDSADVQIGHSGGAITLAAPIVSTQAAPLKLTNTNAVITLGDATGVGNGAQLYIGTAPGTLFIGGADGAVSGVSFGCSPMTVAQLPTASVNNAGLRSFVSDATATTFASIVVGTGSNKVPVYSDGTNWRIG